MLGKLRKIGSVWLNLKKVIKVQSQRGPQKPPPPPLGEGLKVTGTFINTQQETIKGITQKEKRTTMYSMEATVAKRLKEDFLK